jgi:hypothetical protein
MWEPTLSNLKGTEPPWILPANTSKKEVSSICLGVAKWKTLGVSGSASRTSLIWGRWGSAVRSWRVSPGLFSMTRKKHQQSRLMEREHKKMKLKQTISLLRSKMQSRPWYLAQTTYQGNQQHIERLSIEILPFYRVSRQHRVICSRLPQWYNLRYQLFLCAVAGKAKWLH